ncbi:hypothetical protein FI667_g9651, partial [Globisporangium splendens]
MSNLKCFYLMPDVLATPGYAYGTGSVTVRGRVQVQRLNNGRWSTLEDMELELEASQVISRSCVCVARRTDGATERWDYGVVTGYRWDRCRDSGVLHVTFVDASEDVAYDEEYLQDLALETYAIGVSRGLPVVTVMPAEMRERHKLVYDMFHGAGHAATRNVKLICKRLKVTPGEEASKVPLVDIASLKMVMVSVKHILDFVYYHEGGRRAPKSVHLGESVFDDGVVDSQHVSKTANAIPTSRNQKRTGGGELSDSDDDSDRSIDLRSPPRWHNETYARKRPRFDSPTTCQDGDLPARGPAEGDGQSLEAPYSTVPTAAITQLDQLQNDTRSQFRPSALQANVHRLIVNGLYGWDFGTRGLSVMHFDSPSAIDHIIEAVDVLSAVVTLVYSPTVGELVIAARQFFLSLKNTGVDLDGDALDDLVYWLDERFERFL